MRLAYRAPCAASGDWLPWVRELTGRSGVYVIRSRPSFWSGEGRVLYVGESHTGRLRKTLERHFQSWHGPRASPTYGRGDVEIAVRLCRPAVALRLEAELIRRLRPRDNEVRELARRDDPPF